eukprot:scaffold33223_cov38-Cyclotella_meneghiniana.AAC.1
MVQKWGWATTDCYNFTTLSCYVTVNDPIKNNNGKQGGPSKTGNNIANAGDYKKDESSIESETSSKARGKRERQSESDSESESDETSIKKAKKKCREKKKSNKKHNKRLRDRENSVSGGSIIRKGIPESDDDTTSDLSEAGINNEFEAAIASPSISKKTVQETPKKHGEAMQRRRPNGEISRMAIASPSKSKYLSPCKTAAVGSWKCEGNIE